jgi:hypothetical protein
VRYLKARNITESKGKVYIKTKLDDSMDKTTVCDMLEAGQRDVDWFASHAEQLKAEYNNTFIAFHDAQVIESDKKLNTLLKKLHAKQVDTSQVLVRFVSKVKTIL